MSQQTNNLIRQYYDAFNRQDMDAFLALIDDDVVHDLNQGIREVGKLAFAQFMGRMNQSYKESITSLVVMSDETDKNAAAEFVVEGTYLATDGTLPPANGQIYKLAGGAFFEIKDGKIIRITNYYNMQDWLNQVTQS